MSYIRFLIILLLASLCFPYVQAQTPNDIRFTHLGLENGLSHSTVLSITQDKEGCIWLATYDGVNKYDGYEFHVYRNQDKNPRSIASNTATCIATDEENRIWVGTKEGLSLYNADLDNFTNYFYREKQTNTQVNTIQPLSDGRLLLGTTRGVFFFDIKHETFKKAGIPIQTDYAAFYKDGNTVYIGTNHVYTFSLSNKKLKKLVTLPGAKKIQSILAEGAEIWIGTEGQGLFIYNKDTRKLKNYTTANTAILSSNFVRSIATDNLQRIWIGTYNGLFIYDKGLFHAYKSSFVETGSLSQNSVRCIFRDSQGGMWLGTYWGGISYYHPLYNRFTHICHQPFTNSLNDNVISCIVEDYAHNLWVGTSNGGLNYYDPHTQNFSFPTAGTPYQNFFKDIKTIYPNPSDHKTYVGAHAGGILVLDANRRICASLNTSNSNLTSNNIYAIASDGTKDGLWIGSLDRLFHYNLKANHFTPFVKDSEGKRIPAEIHTLFRDPRGALWIGSEQGLASYYFKGNALHPNTDYTIPPILRKSNIYYICESSSRKALLVGSNKGLFMLYKNSKTYKRYTTENGLPGNTVYGILESSNNDLWISTNQGLSCMDGKKRTFRNFSMQDGLQSNQFSEGSCCMDADGNMYFGGINGITKFNPLTLGNNPYSPRPIITGLTVFNQLVRPGDTTGILEKSIERSEEITLKPSQNTFSLSFTVPNYIAGQHNTFAYMLQGYDKEWRTAGSARTASYANLPAGDYTFHLKSANNDGVWNTMPVVLHIRVLPEWYHTWWAILLFTLIVLFTTSQVIRFLWARKIMKEQLKLERVDKKRREEINQMKIRFYVNMSHELRTPLTLITAPLRELMSRITGGWEREQLNYIERNTNRLLHIVNQVMDYRRTELGAFKLHLRKFAPGSYIKRIFEQFEQQAKKQDIYYVLEDELPKGQPVLCDPDYIDLILNNLLSNAFKYSRMHDSVKLRISQENTFLVLQVSDTGIGIPKEKQAKIFERFYQVENGHGGSGIGLSLVEKLVESHHGRIELESAPGEGATFTVWLPQDESVYAPAELQELDRESSETTPLPVSPTPSPTEAIQATTDIPQVHTKDTSTRHDNTVLVVEDNDEMRHFISKGLSDSFNVEEARDGMEALDILNERKNIDIIVTDVMMPRMNGIDLCKAVRRNIQTCHIPVFFLSAKADVTYQQEGLESGANDYIPKPFSLDILRTKLQNTLDTRDRAFAHYQESEDIKPEKLTNNTLDEEFLKKAIEVINENMANTDFSIDEFAANMNISRSNLYRKVKAITGQSTNDFIYKIKFNYACRLLKEGKYNVSEISYMTGFNTPSYFATCFKKYMGCLPTEYGKKAK